MEPYGADEVLDPINVVFIAQGPLNSVIVRPNYINMRLKRVKRLRAMEWHLILSYNRFYL